MSTPDPYKIALADALKRAERWHTLDNIAREIGCGYQSLSKLKSKHVLGPEICAKLEAWLKERHFWESEYTPVPSAKEARAAHGDSITEAIALELEAKAAMLRSDLPEDDKKKLFGSWLRAYNEVWNQLNKGG